MSKNKDNEYAQYSDKNFQFPPGRRPVRREHGSYSEDILPEQLKRDLANLPIAEAERVELYDDPLSFIKPRPPHTPLAADKPKIEDDPEHQEKCARDAKWHREHRKGESGKER